MCQVMHFLAVLINNNYKLLMKYLILWLFNLLTISLISVKYVNYHLPFIVCIYLSSNLGLIVLHHYRHKMLNYMGCIS